jgi:hypothetical protein
MDPFSRYFCEMFNEKSVISVPTAFQCFFGRPEANGSKTVWSTDALTVDIDIIRAAGETHAALVHRGTDARRLGSDKKSINVEKFTSESRVYPLIEEEGEIAASKLLFRNAGENPYSAATRQERMRDRAMEIYEEAVRRTMRAREVLAAESILTGKQSAIFGTTNSALQYDFKRTAGMNWFASKDWTDKTSDILGDIDAASDLCRKKGFIRPEFLGLGETAMKSIISNEDIVEKADNRRFEMIQVSQNNPVPPKFAKFVECGWVPRGSLRTPAGNQLWMFTNNEYYTNIAGAQVKYMPDTKAFVASVDARMDLYIGPPERLPMIGSDVEQFVELFGFNPAGGPSVPNIQGSGIFVPAHYYFDCYRSTNQKSLTCRVQHAPIFATTQADAISVIETEAP